jgi:hypothetical protein
VPLSYLKCFVEVNLLLQIFEKIFREGSDSPHSHDLPCPKLLMALTHSFEQEKLREN